MAADIPSSGRCFDAKGYQSLLADSNNAARTAVANGARDPKAVFRKINITGLDTNSIRVLEGIFVIQFKLANAERNLRAKECLLAEKNRRIEVAELQIQVLVGRLDATLETLKNLQTTSNDLQEASSNYTFCVRSHMRKMKRLKAVNAGLALENARLESENDALKTEAEESEYPEALEID